MTIVVPVPIPPAGLPLPDPADRATFSARKLEQLRWANNEYSTGSLALANASYSNALDSQASASSAAVSKTAVDNNIALMAGYANAPAWVAGTYALNFVVYAPANRRLYRKITASSATVTDPSLDPTNWGLINTEAPFEVVTSLIKQGVSGGYYSLQNVTTQAAATNLALWSNNAENAVWVNTAVTVSPNVALDANGDLFADKLVESATNAQHYQVQTWAISATVAYNFSRRFKASGRTSVVQWLDDGSAGLQCTLNLTTGAVTAVTNAGTASGATATAEFLGDGWWELDISGIPATAGSTVRSVTFVSTIGGYLGDGTSGILVSAAQLVTGTTKSSRIPTQGTSVTRSAGVVAPQRVILPSSPLTNDFISVNIANGIEENFIDPNGQPIADVLGAMKVDNKNTIVNLQYIRNAWRLV